LIEKERKDSVGFRLGNTNNPAGKTCSEYTKAMSITRTGIKDKQTGVYEHALPACTILDHELSIYSS
jgi:alcohol dehydrogenase class IV